MAKIRAKGLVADHRLGDKAEGVIPLASEASIEAARSASLNGLLAFVDPRAVIGLPDAWTAATVALTAALAGLWQHGVREVGQDALLELTGATARDLPRLLRLVARDGIGHVQAEAARGRVRLAKGDARLMRPALWRPLSPAALAETPAPLLRAWMCYETAAASRSAGYRYAPEGIPAWQLHQAAGAAVAERMPEHVLGTHLADDGTESLEARPREERSGYVSFEVQQALSTRDRKDLSLRWTDAARALEAVQGMGLHISPDELRRLWLVAASCLARPDEGASVWPFPFPFDDVLSAHSAGGTAAAVRALGEGVVKAAGATIHRRLPSPWVIAEMEAEALEEAADARYRGDTSVRPWLVGLRRQSVGGWLDRQRKRLVRVPPAAIVAAAITEEAAPEVRAGVELLAERCATLKGADVREAAKAAGAGDVLDLLAWEVVEAAMADAEAVMLAARELGGREALAHLVGRAWRAAVEARRPYVPVLRPEVEEEPEPTVEADPALGALAMLVRPAARPLVLAGDYTGLLNFFRDKETSAREYQALASTRRRAPSPPPAAPSRRPYSAREQKALDAMNAAIEAGDLAALEAAIAGIDLAVRD